MAGPVLILGATSAIARSAAVAFAERGHPLFLAGRNQESLDRSAQDLRVRHGVTVHTGVFDAQNYATHAKFFDDVVSTMGGLEGALLSFGYLGDPQAAAKRVDEAVTIISRNFTGAVSILTHVANYLEAQRGGFIVAVTAVAADRGHPASYVYGAAKAGLTTYLDGLRGRLQEVGARVVTVKPGQVDAPTMFGKPGLFLTATPDSVGKRIVTALDHSIDTIYVPWFWEPIVKVMKGLPGKVFKRLSF